MEEVFLRDKNVDKKCVNLPSQDEKLILI